MNIDVFSKRVTNDFENKDLCYSGVYDTDVKELYYMFKDECNRYIVDKNYSNERRFYIYIWYTKTTPRKIFYVGKGTSKRYKHILTDIQNYKNGKFANNIRFEKYSIIQDLYGIEYKIVKKDLNEKEALIYEQCLKLFYLKKGEVLLNVEGIPQEYLPEGWDDVDTDIPTIERSKFRERYFNENQENRKFHKVSKKELLRCYIYQHFSKNIDNLDLNLVKEFVNDNRGKLYKTVSKGTQSIIICGFLRAEKYDYLKANGKKIYSLKDVIKFIKYNENNI